MVEVRYKARLGNNLFQYCLGRILAEHLGFALRASRIPGFPNTASHVEGAVYHEPPQVLTGQRILLQAILADRAPRHISLDGWFQRHEYYRPYRAAIREWLTFDPRIRVPEVQPDVVAHVRRTDFVQLGWALPSSFYENALQHLQPRDGQLWIATDDRRDPFFRTLQRWKPRFYQGPALGQLLFMSRARRLVMSQSTFSWWPTFLGDQEEVVCPVPSFGAWSPEGEAAEANLIERDRFTCLECPDPYVATDAELRHQRWRMLKRRLILKVNRSFPLSLTPPPP